MKGISHTQDSVAGQNCEGGWADEDPEIFRHANFEGIESVGLGLNQTRPRLATSISFA